MAWNYPNNPMAPGYGFAQLAPNYGQNFSPQPPQMQVTRVNGRGGADAFSMGPNSSALLLDECGTIVWLVTTDGAGYKTISDYDISPHQHAPAPDFAALEARISKLEGLINDTANTAAAERGKGGKSA